jgi:AmmeMemoRadiSam system protein B
MAAMNGTVNRTNGASHFPRLRPLDVRPLIHEGQHYILLRDPQQLSEHQLLIPQPLAAVLAFCDGHHDVPKMVAAFQQHYGLALPEESVGELLEVLDAAVMLDNERATAAHEAARAAFHREPYREPALAGPSYPSDDTSLWRLLQDYLEEAGDIEPLTIDWSRPVGLLSPHIDYGRGGQVYAQVWKRAEQAAREAELVILLGTDHYGSDLFSLTRQNYATPYGVLPTDTAIVDQLAAVIGEKAAYAGELRHCGEHSLELVAVWLHHMRAGEPVPVVPILTGSFQPFLEDGIEPEDDETIRDVVQTLRQAMQGRHVLVVASGDLAHVGPAFGGRPLTSAGREKLRAADEELIAAMKAGDAAGFFAAIRRVQNCNNVCGVAPISLAMQLVGDQPGEQWGYATCPADEKDTSVVTVTGMLFAQNTVGTFAGLLPS